METNAQQEVDKPHFLVAIYLPVSRWRYVIPFLRATSAIRRQLKGTPGLVSYQLKSNFFRRQFWTLSVWRDRASINAYVRSGAHAQAMQHAQEWAGPWAAFAEWTGTSGGVSWKDALERLKEPTFYLKSTTR